MADASQSLDGVSRVVPHPDGTLIVLPAEVGAPLRTLTSADLEPVDGGEVDLPEGASVLDGDVSPDGSQLALLATLSGRPVEYDTDGSHVVTIDLVEGVPVAGTVTTNLRSPDRTVAIHGHARQIRWLDDVTWAIERGISYSRRIEFVGVDDGELLALADVGLGSGLTPVAEGLLLQDRDGVTLVDRSGELHPGEPAPALDRPVDRVLSISPIVDAPPFEVDVADPVTPLTITPLAPDRSAASSATTVVVGVVRAVVTAAAIAVLGAGRV